MGKRSPGIASIPASAPPQILGRQRLSGALVPGDHCAKGRRETEPWQHRLGTYPESGSQGEMACWGEWRGTRERWGAHGRTSGRARSAGAARADFTLPGGRQGPRLPSQWECQAAG